MPKKKNKKIRNATICKSGSIVFKSQLEKMAYNTLVEYGFTPQYEPRRLVLVEGFKPTIPFYDKETPTQYNKRIEKAKLALMRKGFGFDVIDQAISQIDAEIDEDEQSQLLKQAGMKLWKKYRAEEPYQRRQKLKQSLYRKGFDFDAIDDFVDEVERN